MTAQQLFPRPPKRMRQPRKDAIRLRAELAEARLAYERTPMWWRLWRRIWVRIVEVDPPELRIVIKATGLPPSPPPPRTLPGIAP